MNHQEIMTYWYKYLHKNYPFIQWIVEVEEDQRMQFHPFLLNIIGINLVCKLESAIIHLYQDCNKGDRSFTLQNKRIARGIKMLVKDLKIRSAEHLKQDMIQ